MSVRQVLCLVVLLVSCRAAGAAEPAKAARNVKEIIGHRGSCADRPENTLASYRRAIEAGATAAEIDVRTTRDGALVCLHDADLSRTSNGKGMVGDKTLAELKQLDFGSWFEPKFKDERIATMQEVLQLCRDKIDVMLDLKETGQDYADKVAALVRKHGQPKRIIVGVRSAEQARQFRKLLPEARQIGLIPQQKDIEAFAAAGVETIRLWPKWLTDPALVPAVRKHKLGLHLGAGKGTKDEVLPLLPYEPESLSSDDPARLLQTLAEIGQGRQGADRKAPFYPDKSRLLAYLDLSPPGHPANWVLGRMAGRAKSGREGATGEDLGRLGSPPPAASKALVPGVGFDGKSITLDMSAVPAK